MSANRSSRLLGVLELKEEFQMASLHTAGTVDSDHQMQLSVVGHDSGSMSGHGDFATHFGENPSREASVAGAWYCSSECQHSQIVGLQTVKAPGTRSVPSLSGLLCGETQQDDLTGWVCGSLASEG